MRRLEELLRQMVQAAKSIGNTELENKFSEGIKLIKRDIIFAASLYLWNKLRVQRYINKYICLDVVYFYIYFYIFI